MSGLWEILGDALPEIIGGLVVAAILALIGSGAQMGRWAHSIRSA